MSIWQCQKCGTLTGPDPRPCPKCGGPTEYWNGIGTTIATSGGTSFPSPAPEAETPQAEFRACADGECPLHLGTPSHLGEAQTPALPAEPPNDGLADWTPKFTVWLVTLKESWPWLVDSVWTDEHDARKRAEVRGPDWEVMRYSHLQPPTRPRVWHRISDDTFHVAGLPPMDAVAARDLVERLMNLLPADHPAPGEAETRPAVMLQDGRSPEWTCPTCGGDGLWCKCTTEFIAVRQRAEAAEARCAALAAERDEYKALAKVGPWHNDCRPNRHMAARELLKSQAVNDKLADTITSLNAELDAERTQRTTTEQALREMKEVAASESRGEDVALQSVLMPLPDAAAPLRVQELEALCASLRSELTISKAMNETVESMALERMNAVASVEMERNTAYAALREAWPYVKSAAEASHLLDGFSRGPKTEADRVNALIESALARLEGSKGPQ